MRLLTNQVLRSGGILALVLLCGLVVPCAAQARPASRSAFRLAPIAAVQTNPVTARLLEPQWAPVYSPTLEGLKLPGQTDSTTALLARLNTSPGVALGGSFAMPAYSGTRFDDPHLVQADRLVAGQGVVRWRSGEIVLAAGTQGAAVSAVRLSLGALERTPAGLVVGPPRDVWDAEPQAFDVSYTRGWPSAVMLRAGTYDLDITPHAGFGLSNIGGSAEAGAMVRLGAGLKNDRARQIANGLGLSTVDGSRLDAAGRWYLFAAASGRAVGLNVTRDGQTGDLRRSGWSIDPTAVIIGDAQAGIGWRQGSVQASLGYLHRTIKNEFGLRGTSPRGDSLLALSFTIRPSQ